MDALAVAREAVDGIAQEFRGQLDEVDYVPRLLVQEREGVDPEFARVRRHLLLPGHPDRADCVEEDDLQSSPRVVLVGNAGAGKTLTLKHMYTGVAKGFLSGSSGSVPLWLDLGRDLGTDLQIEKALLRSTCGLWRAAGEVELPVALFIDALDEAFVSLDQPRQFVVDLASFFEEHSGILNQIFIACRRPAWSNDYFRTCAPALQTYSLDSVGEYEWESKIPDHRKRARFFRLCSDLGIASLLDSPFHGFYLADEFLAGRDLPRSRPQCFDARTRAALTRARPTDQTYPQPAIDRLRYLAEQLACVFSFTSKSACTTQEAHDLLNSGQPPALPERPSEGEIVSLLVQPLFYRSGATHAFTHQLFREYLVATALNSVSLAKQRQLLESSVPFGQRVCLQFRNLAAFLAELSEEFQEHLLKHDPLVAFLAEAPWLSPEEDEGLAHSVVRIAIDQHIAPWWAVTPEGQTLGDALPKHRPPDVASFLEPFFEGEEEIALIWATECVLAWEGGQRLGAILSPLAHSPDLNVTIRVNAVNAIAASGEGSRIEDLLDLLSDQDDQVRGAVLRAYREHANPSPAEYIAQLHGGVNQEDLLGSLRIDPRDFAAELDRPQLREAFEALVDGFEALGNIRAELLGYLVDRALQLDFEDVPAELFVMLWESGHHDQREHYYVKKIDSLLSQHSSLFEAVFERCVDELSASDFTLDWWKAAQVLGRTAIDGLFEILPTASSLNTQQNDFVKYVLGNHFGKDSSLERLGLFQSSAPDFTNAWTLPPAPLPEPERDLRAERQEIVEVIDMASGDPLGQAINVVRLANQIEKGGTVGNVSSLLDRHGPDLQGRVLDIFTQMVQQTQFARKMTSIEPLQVTFTRHECEIAFWYAVECGIAFDVHKTAEVIACYGFRTQGDHERYLGLLEDIRSRDRSCWEQVVNQLLEDPIAQLHHVVEYLTELDDSFYLARCTERLENGWVFANHLIPLIHYLDHFRPGGYQDALWQTYQLLRQYVPRADIQGVSPPPDPNVLPDLSSLGYWRQFDVLVKLIEYNESRAWDELAQRVARGDVPLSDHDWWAELDWPEWPHDPSRAPILADWFALVREAEAAAPLSTHHFSNLILEALIAVGGNEAALSELNALRERQAFPGAKWLSYQVLQIENTMLSQPRGAWQTADLLRFLNRELYRVVNSEKDLFECVCQAIDELQAVLNGGDLVNAFWDGQTPKREVDCQNILWPLLRQILSAWGVTGVEERTIGPSLCDFWVEMPRPAAPHFRVAVELKVALRSYGRRELIAPVEEQLWEQYLKPTQCGHGIYVVLWFKREPYPYPEVWETIEDLKVELARESDRVSAERNVSIRSFIIDVTAPPRRR